MNTKIKRLLTTLIMAICLPHLAIAGNEGAHGGDELGLQFQSSYLTALDNIRHRFPDLNHPIADSALGEQIDLIRVVMVDEPLQVEVAGHKQDSVAVNYKSELLILVNRLRWSQIVDENIRQAIALHEVLSLAELEGSGLYPISSKYLSRISNTKSN